MSDHFITFIEEKRGKLHKQIQKLEEQLAELDKSEKLYRASGAATTFSSPSVRKPAVANSPQNHSSAKAAVDALATSHYDIQSTYTIKERVLAILEKHNKGLTSAQILRALRTTGLPNIERVSLSPQLSRLSKKDRLLDAHDGVYCLKTKNEESDDLESLV